MSAPKDADEWEYEAIMSPEHLEPVAYVRAGCRHRRLEPVMSGGECVAQLCLTCDAQLPGDWRA